ncbi:reverse transcriptase domain-containing protein [Artemisia annua]|uniref:Reverse transcriptase domain-containing protein n=1 Tax=Artemisia annua TaxID=35608 RepID=A0A2U1PDE8_ARTAN|nr:reverse transcriptase domain-containing protein [Artemisia annua]
MSQIVFTLRVYFLVASSSSTSEGTWSCPFKGFHCCPSGVCGNKGISRMISHLKSVHLSTDERKNVLREAITTDYNLFREVEGTLKVFGQWMCGKCMRLHALSRACHHPDGLVRFSEGMGDGGSAVRGGGSQNRGGGSLSRGGGSQNRGSGSKKRGGGSQTMGGASQTRGGGSISRGKGSKNRGGGQRITRLGQRKMEGKIPSTQRYYTLLCICFLFELQYQKDIEAEKEVLEEEERKRAEWEQNGRIYLDLEDMQSDQFSENELDRPATLSELEALDEAIDEYNATLPSIDEGQPSQTEPTPPHLVQAPTEESQAPRAPRPRPVIRLRPPLPKEGSSTILQMALERLLKSHSVSELLC